MSEEEQPLPVEPEPPPPPPPPPPPRVPFWSYFDVLIFIGAALPCMLLGVGFVKLIQMALHWKPRSDVLVLLPAQAAGYLLLFGVLYLMFQLQEQPFWKPLGFVPPRLPAGWVVSAGFATAILVVTVGNLIATPNTDNEMTRMLKDPLALIPMAIFGVLIAPLCEELAFRGFLQPLLVRSFGTVPGILGAAIPFGILHYHEYGNSWRHALLVSMAGAAFGWMRHAARSTMASAIMHAAYNALFFAAFFAAKDVTH